MLRRLRKKFVLIAMGSVLAVIVLIVGVINIVNYYNVVNNADHIVLLLKEGGGGFGGNKFGEGGEPQNGHGKPFSPETPFETRFFTVILDANGEALFVNTDRIAAVDETEAASCAEYLFGKRKETGFYGNYRYGTTDSADGTMYIFVDCTKELSSFRNFLFVSIPVGASAFLTVSALVFSLSGRAMKPISEAYAKQKRFITDASHELKTPLTVIGADAEVLEMQGVENEWTKSIKEQVMRLSSLTEKLVFLARMDEESGRLQTTDFSLSDAVEEAVKPFQAIALSKGMTIACEIQRSVTYCGDEGMLRQVVSLLTDNALKYSDENGTIEVTLKSAGGRHVLTVANPAKDLDGDLSILFERFYRSDKSRNSETGGHGVGLAVANAIVTAHKGKLKAHAENGKAIFTVIL